MSNLFVFGADGTIIACCINAPGSVHDSSLADWGNIYGKLETIHSRLGLKCVMDSAFCAKDHPFILKSSQDITTVGQNAAEIARLRDATSMRQAAEWGMRALQGSSPRLKDRLLYEEFGERKNILECAVLLYNLRTSLVGLNQIRNRFTPMWSKDSEDLMNTYR